MPSVSYSGATVLVTGASSGIGREMARQLAPRARRLVLVARRAQRLEALAAELSAAHPRLDVAVRPCDLADPDAVEALGAALVAEGGVDVLLNNAGLGAIGLFEQESRRHLRTMLQVNVTGLTLLTHALLPGMLERRRGGILFVSSGFGLFWMPVFAAYAGSKHYVTAFSDALRLELSGTGVVVSQVCPGPVATEFESSAGNDTGFDIPSWVEMTPEEVARISLRALERGRALVVPGRALSVLLWLNARTPRWVFRLILAWVGPFVRRRRANPA